MNRFPGAVVLTPFTRHEVEAAKEAARRAANHKSSWSSLELNIFSDASRDPQRSTGGYAVTFSPWLPWETADNSLVEAAWPLDPLYDSSLGELVAIAKSLALAHEEIRDNRRALVESGQTVTVTVFNDGKTGLRILDGFRPNEPLWKLVRPVVHLIEKQSHALSTLGPTVRLFFRWIPGHHHDIEPHVRADRLSRTARKAQKSYCPRYNNTWKTYMESPTVRWLKQSLLQASLHSAAIKPRLRRHLRHPLPLPAGVRCPNALQVYLDGVLPALGRKKMPAQWSDSWSVRLETEDGGEDIELWVPLTRSNHRVFVNDGINHFAVVLDNPTPPAPTTELVLYSTVSSPEY